MDVHEDPSQLTLKKPRSPLILKAKREPPSLRIYSFSDETREIDSEPKQHPPTVGQAILDHIRRLGNIKEDIMKSPIDLNNPKEEYCMSDEFIDQLDKKAKLYFNSKKQFSGKEIISYGFKHKTEEAFLAFRNYLAENDLVEVCDYKFGELLCHCFTVEEYRKVYCHYNFTIEMKKKNEEVWTSCLYFAETKLKQGVKYYFCSPIKVADDGPCYSCTNQCVNDLKHPPVGGYETGHKSSGSHIQMLAVLKMNVLDSRQLPTLQRS